MGDCISFNLENSKEIPAHFKNYVITAQCLLSYRKLAKRSTIKTVHFSEVIKKLTSFYGSCKSTCKKYCGFQGQLRPWEKLWFRLSLESKRTKIITVRACKVLSSFFLQLDSRINWKIIKHYWKGRTISMKFELEFLLVMTTLDPLSELELHLVSYFIIHIDICSWFTLCHNTEKFCSTWEKIKKGGMKMNGIILLYDAKGDQIL